MGYRTVKKNYEDMFSRFYLIPERYGRTDIQTDIFDISISRVSMLTRVKNRTMASNKRQVSANVRSVAHQLSHRCVHDTLVDRLVDNTLLETRPCSNQAFLRIIDVEHRRATNAFLQHAADLVVDRI